MYRASLLMRRSTRVRWRVSLPIVLTIMPLLWLVAVLFTQTVDVPFADQWALVPLLDHLYRGKLGWADLWAQHNEHRLFLPRVLMLGLARLTSWNTQAEMLCSVFLAAATLVIIIWQLRATAQALGMACLWLVPALSAAMFSLSQAESWWGGWNMQIFLCLLAAIATLTVLACSTQRCSMVLFATLCACAAGLSYGPGLAVWPIGLGILMLQRNVRQLVLWLVCGTLFLWLYFWGYQWSAESSGLGTLATNPIRYLQYLVIYLGAAPMRGTVEWLFGLITGDTAAICNLGDSDLCRYVITASSAMGSIGLISFGALVMALSRSVPWRLWIAYASYALFSLAAGAMTSFARAGYGDHQALAQRYATLATPFWVALIVLSAIWAHQRGLRNRWPALAIGGCAMLFVLCSLQGLDHFRVQRAFLTSGRDALIRGEHSEALARLFPDPQVVEREAEILRHYHLSVFR